MARIQFNSLISNIQGSIGNLTIQRNATGYSVRQKPISLMPATESQLVNRAWLLQCQSAWHSLSTEAVVKWNSFPAFIKTFAKHNPDVLLTGYQLFLKHNLRLLAAGKPILLNVQYCSNAFQNPEFGIYGAGEVFGMDLSEGFDESLYAVFVKCTCPLRYPTNYPEQYYRVVIPNVVESFELQMFPQYSNVFGRGPAFAEYVYVSIQYLHLLMPYAQAPFVQWFQNNW